MSSSNRTGSTPLTFILAGIPGLPARSFRLALPPCCLYLLVLLGSCTSLWVVKTDHSPRAPMYCLLSMLSLAHLGPSLSTLPTVLAVLWSESPSLRSEACVAQMCFIHSSAIEPGLLVAVALDRSVAIRYPLHCASVLTNSLDMLRLVCGGGRVSSLYGLTVVILTEGLDPLTTLLSYTVIIRAILSSVSREARAKAFSTCSSHLSAVLIFYIPLIGLSISHRLGKHLTPLTLTPLADAYLLVPPVLNPLVYSWQTKRIRRQILILLCWGGSQQGV